MGGKSEYGLAENSEQCDWVFQKWSRGCVEFYDVCRQKSCQCRNNIFHCFCICLLYSPSEREITRADEEAFVCLFTEEKGGTGTVGLLIDLQDIFQFSDKAVCGSINSGDDVFRRDDDHTDAVCDAGRRLDCLYRTDPHFRCIHRLCGRCIPDFDGGSFESSDLCNHVSGTAADRGQLHLPEGGWKFRRASVHLGTGSSQYRRQSHGRCRNAGLHPDGFCPVYTAAGKHIS